MKTSIPWSLLVLIGLWLGAAGVQAESARDAEVLVPLARGLVGVTAPGDAVPEGAVLEELPAVIAARPGAAETLATHVATHKAYWLALLSLGAVAAGALSLRRRTQPAEPRLSAPPCPGEGRISFV